MSATLNLHEFEQQHRIITSLLHFAGIETGVYPKDTPTDALSVGVDLEKKMEVRKHIVENSDLITQHVKANINGLSGEDLEIAAGFKDFVYGEFFIISYLKKHTLFLSDTNFVYGVHALGDPFEVFYHPKNLPVRVQALLFPFKDKIIYDGVLQGYRIHFGGNMSASIRRSCQEAKAKYGVITTLPFQVEEKSAQEKDEELLTFYMKTAKNRSYYEYEIDELLERNHDLLPLYYRECGKIHARSRKKTLKKIEIKKRHFAIVDDTIIASGKTPKEVKQQVEDILDNETKTWVHYFKV